MALSKVDEATSNASTDSNSLTTLKEPVNASKLNELLSNVNDRLAGGLHGEYFEKGSRLDDKHRHGQLETVFRLREELADIKALIGKQELRATEAEKTKTSAKGAGPPASKNMIATIKTVVQQELSDKLRDLLVRSERLEDTVKKADDRSEMLANKVKTLESKIKTLESKLKKAEERNDNPTGKPSDSRSRVSEARVKKPNIGISATNTKLAGSDRRVQTSGQQAQRLERSHSGNLKHLQYLMDLRDECIETSC